MQIIQGTLHELGIIAELFNEYRMFYQQESDIEGARTFVEDRIKNNESVIYLAIDPQKSSLTRGLGFTQLYPSFSSVSMQKVWILNDLYVLPHVRKQGVARALIAQAKQLAHETRAKGLSLETTIDNDNAQKLYHQTGFRKDDTLHYHFHLAKE